MRRKPDPMTGSPRRFLWLAMLLAAVLRVPSLPVSLWNIDEANMAAAADILVSGGIYYKDVVDHRGPLTPYIFAGVFSVFGRYNMLALRILLLLVVVGNTILVWMVGKRVAGLVAGNCAAALFAVAASVTFPASDLLAFNTEWSLALFVLAGSFLVISMGNNKLMGFVAGVSFGLAFFSKQTAAMECIGVAVFALLLVLGRLFRKESKGARQTVTTFLMVGGGFGLTVGCVVSFFWVAGAWKDFLFGFWTYNTRYYVGTISVLDRLKVLGNLFGPKAGTTTLGFLAIAGGLVAMFQAIRLNGRGDPRGDSLLYCVIWGMASVSGMILSGRFFGHYFIQVLAPLCCLIGIGYGALDTAIRESPKGKGKNVLKGIRVVVVLGVVLSLSIHLQALLPKRLDQQKRWVVDSPTEGLSRYLEEHSDAEDRIFVWGFYPHPYVLAKRSPASRYTFCTFVSGSNAGDQVRGRPVPGAMDRLVVDLHRSSPRFIIDTSPWGYFGWGPYPLENFPKLKRFVETGYVRDIRIQDADGTVHFNVFRRQSETLDSEVVQ